MYVHYHECDDSFTGVCLCHNDQIVYLQFVQFFFFNVTRLFVEKQRLSRPHNYRGIKEL